MEGDIETSDMRSNMINIDWPPKSGRKIEIPEVDRWEWFSTDESQQKINPAQTGFILQVEEIFSLK